MQQGPLSHLVTAPNGMRRPSSPAPLALSLTSGRGARGRGARGRGVRGRGARGRGAPGRGATPVSRYNPTDMDGKIIVFQNLGSTNSFCFASTDPVESDASSLVPNHKRKNGYTALLRRGHYVHDDVVRASFKWIVRVLPGSEKTFLLESYKFPGHFLSVSNETHPEFPDLTDRRCIVEPLRMRTEDISRHQNASDSRFRFYFLGRNTLHSLVLCCKRSEDAHPHLVYANSYLVPRNQSGFWLAKSAPLITNLLWNDDDALYNATSNEYRYRVYQLRTGRL